MAENDSAGIACSNVRNGLEGLLRRLEPSSYELWITGSNNFRHRIYPEYKANRTTPKPQFLGACRDYLVKVFGAKVSDGCEADDMLGIIQTQQMEHGNEVIISSIDKDLLMIPGWHHIPELKRLGNVIRPEARKFVSPLEGLQFFYRQLLTGDPTDNIKGVVGVGGKGATKLLENLSTEREFFDVVRAKYGCDEELELNARCLWIMRYPNENIVERWRTLFNYEQDVSNCGTDVRERQDSLSSADTGEQRMAECGDGGHN